MDAIRRFAAAVCLAALGAAAQDRSASESAVPVFRSGTRMVQVDVVVRNKKGAILGLTKDQFTLQDNGKPQSIAAFSAPQPPGAATPLPPGAVSNRFTPTGDAPSGVTVVLLDALNTDITLQPFVFDQLRKLVRERGGKERMAIYVLDDSLRVVQDFTTDRQHLEEVIDKLKPIDAHHQFKDMSGREDAIRLIRDRQTTTLGAMNEIARHLSSVPGRKSIVWISASFPLGRGAIDARTEIAEAMRVVSDANVAVYPVDARGLVPGRRGPGGLDTLNTIADQTGGRAYYNTNGIAQSVGQAIDDGDRVYTLGFYPSDDAFDGKFHKLRVRVNVSGAEVRARPGYFADKTAQANQARPSLQQLLRDGLDASTIGLVGRVEPAPDGAAEGTVMLAVAIDIHDLHLELKDGNFSGAVDFVVADTGNAATIAVPFQITEGGLKEALEKTFGLGWQIPIVPTAGTRELRVVVQDRATGSAGSIRVPLPSK